MATARKLANETQSNLPFAYKHYSAEELKEVLRRMYLIRRFEEGAEDSYTRGLIHGTMHLSIGQEASAMGICMPLTSEDQITSTHRGHGHCIAKGADVKRMFAEFFGKTTGYCKGRGGSMHIADVSMGNLGANGIVAGGIPIAVGAALSAKRLKTGKVVVSFFGDGANNEGAFHEALNMASIWKLPVIFVCENNGYGMSTSTARSTAVKNIADRAAAYSMPGVIVNGNIFSEVAEASHAAVERARAGEGPTLIESKTYRYRGHSKSDRNRYRTKEEIEDWISNRDPIALFEADLKEFGFVDEKGIEAIREAVRAEIEAGIEFAKASPSPGHERSRTIRLHGAGLTMDATPRELSYSQAIQEAMAIAMEADERVFLMGEDIGVYGGAFQVTGDLVERFGPDRVMDTPISELGGAGVAVGAALTGLRPIFEFQFSDFATLAMEQIVNQAAKMRFMLGGEVSVPVVMRFPAGSGTGAAAQHSQSLEAWLGHVPGLKVLQPATPHDAKGLLLAAIADPDPVMIFEHKLLYKMKGPVPEGHYTVPIGKAEIRREGTDLTIVATSIMVHKALEAAETLAGEGIDIEVVDLRTIRPMDKATIIESVKKTSRLLCVYEAVKTLGIGAEVSAAIAESEAFDYLDAPIVRLGGAETPIPYNPELEKATVPQVPGIVAVARDLVRGKR